MKKQFKRWLATMLITILTINCIQTVSARPADNIDSEDYEDYEIWLIDDINASPSNATPSDATPSDATPSDATPSDATPANAVQVTTYGGLQQALASASNGTRIEIMNDLSPEDGSIHLNDKLDAVTGATLAVTKEDVTVEGNGYTIQGNGYPTFDSDGGELTVENLTIDGAGYHAKIGGAVFVEDGGKLTMKNVTMQNCIAGRNAVFSGGGAVYVNNHGGNAPTFIAVDCEFINNSAPQGRGGAVYGTTGNVILDGCTFTGNNAANGGAVAMDGICSLTMTNCTVSDNSADVSGGGVYIYHGDSIWKKNMKLTSRVTASINDSNQIINNMAGLAGDNILYGRYYLPGYSGNRTETTLSATAYDDVIFTTLKRNQITGSYYLEKVNDTWYLRCDTESDISVILQSIETVTVDGTTVALADVFDNTGAVRLDNTAVFADGSKDCYAMTITGGIISGTMMVGDLSLDRWNHEPGWISFITYIDSTESKLVSLWQQAADKNNMDVEQFKGIWRSFCEIGNDIETIKVNGNVITAYRHDNSVVFSNTYVCTDKIMNGLEGDVTYGFEAQGEVADEQFRYLVMMEPGYDGDGSIAAHFHFRYGADGFDALFTGANNYWYPTMCDAGASLEEQCNVLKAMFQLSETGNSGENAISKNPGSSSSGSSSSSSSGSTGQWKLDAKGWWYRYDNGTWPENRWVYLYYNGIYAWYHFDAEGYIQTGWFTDTDDNRYYLNPLTDGSQGAMKTGWVLIDGSWYYFNDSTDGPKGALLTSTTTPDGYQVDENGVWSQM